MLRFMATVALVVLGIAPPVVAAPGDLDPTFGVGGKAIAPFAGSLVDGDILPDGRILAVGGTLVGGYSTITLARFDDQGTLDGTFGVGGVVTTPLTDGKDIVFGMTLLPDGRFLVAGETETNVNTLGTAIILRYLADGTLDPSFGDGGVVRTSFGAQRALARSALQQPNGKIVLAGVTRTNGAYRFALARFEADGSPDPTFGAGGEVVTTLLGVSDILSAAALQPDGKIVVGGAVENEESLELAFARYRPDGTLDPSFGSNGLFLSSAGGGLAYGINDLVLQPDGKIVGVGSKISEAPSNQTFVIRLDANGVPDPTFGTAGVLATAVGGAFLADGVLVQPDGSIVSAGQLYYNSGGNEGLNTMVLRADASGILDGGFGVGGVVGVEMGGNDFWRSVRRQLDGKLLALGTANSTTTGGFAMARFEGTPAACGNGVTEPPETCDDGNVAPGDGCGASCGIEPGYACTGMPSACTVGCGDGAIAGSEECDDGALVDGDGCGATCRTEPGWTCTGAPSSCAAVCGDSRIVGAEQCDDGNIVAADCCSVTCQLDAAGSPCADDGNACSAEACGATGVCQHSFEPDPTCLLPIEPGKAQLKLQARGPGKDQLQFKWTKGPAVSKATFGTPSAGTPNYGLCVYDESSGAPTLVLGVTASADADCSDKACWVEKSSSWQLKNKTGAPNGIVAMKLQAGAEAGKSKVQATLKGSFVALPSLPFANDPRVVAQVRASDGQCYGATFATPTSNDGTLYKAKSE